MHLFGLMIIALVAGTILIAMTQREARGIVRIMRNILVALVLIVGVVVVLGGLLAGL